MLNGLDLFSGIGGITTALDGYVRPLVYCESDRYCQAVLLSNQQQGFLPCAPIWDDVRTLQADYFPNVDIIYGGFPCQDISVAGTGRGLDGERSGLFFEIVRLCRDIRPRFVFLENVPAITVRGLDRVCLELTAMGYDCRWTIVSASELGACHLRERWFMLAYSDRGDIWSESVELTKCEAEVISELNEYQRDVAYANGERLEGFRGSESRISRPCVYNGWNSQPVLRRGAHGLSSRVDRVKGLGNAVVPIQAREAFERLCGLK